MTAMQVSTQRSAASAVRVAGVIKRFGATVALAGVDLEDTARSYALVGGVPSSLGGTAAWILGLLALFIPLCIWRYRRMS